MDRLIEVAQNADLAEKLFALLDGMGIGQQQVVRDQRQDGPPKGAGALTRFAEQMRAKKPAQTPVLMTEDGEPLELVQEGDLPEPYDETRRARDDE